MAPRIGTIRGRAIDHGHSMTGYFIFKFLHVFGAVIFLGSGAAIALFMLIAHRSGNAAFIAATASAVGIANMLFTATTGVAQPFTGAILMVMSSTGMTEPWIVASFILYMVAGLCWLPVLLMQVEMRKLAEQAAAAQAPLPPRYHALFRRWFLLGTPSFGSVIAILWLMIAKPSL